MTGTAIARCAPWLWVMCAGCSMSNRVTAAAPPTSTASPETASAMPDAEGAPDVPPSERASSIADAMAQLDDSEKALTRELARKAAPRGGARKSEQPDTNDADKRSGTPAEPCDTACTALRSMRRSSEYLCKLTGDVDARCTEARDRVRRAQDRVTSSCGACPIEAPLSLIDWSVETSKVAQAKIGCRLALPDVP